MRISVFAASANPEKDRRLYPVSSNRAKELVDSGRAKPLDSKRVQLLPEPEDLQASCEDWRVVHRSLIGQTRDGALQFLNISTLQLV